MALKDQIDIQAAIDAASVGIENLPSGVRQAYQRRYYNLQKLGAKILNSSSVKADWERDFISLVLADPTEGTSTKNWAAQGKLIRMAHSHHRVPLKFNKGVLTYAPPAYHYKTTGYLKDNHDLRMGNVPGNRISTHQVAHTGSSKIISGPGSVKESLHPKGTNEGFWLTPPHKDVTPKEYAEQIASNNEGMVQTAQRAYSNPDGLIQRINNEIQKYTDLDIKTAKPADVYREVNRHRRKILDRVELDTGLGHRTLKSIDPITAATVTAVQGVRKNPLGSTLGGVAGAIADPEAVASALEGDYKGAAANIAGGTLIGAGTQGIVKASPLIIQKGASKLTPVLAGASIFAEGREGSATNRIVNKAAEFTPGLKANPDTDIGKRAGDWISTQATKLKDSLKHSFTSNTKPSNRQNCKINRRGRKVCK